MFQQYPTRCLFSTLLLFLSITGCARPNAPRSAAADPTASRAIEAVREAAQPITGQPGDYDPLLGLIGDNRFVLLGEATHGTQEFYAERARITQRLIQDKGFSAIAIEGDWHDADRVNRFIRGLGQDPGAEQALANFTDEFPDWMWANSDMRDLVTWLREHMVYQPQRERQAHYFMARLPQQFDAVIHLDETRAVEPL